MHNEVAMSSEVAMPSDNAVWQTTPQRSHAAVVERALVLRLGDAWSVTVECPRKGVPVDAGICAGCEHFRGLAPPRHKGRRIRCAHLNAS